MAFATRTRFLPLKKENGNFLHKIPKLCLKTQNLPLIGGWFATFDSKLCFRCNKMSISLRVFSISCFAHFISCFDHVCSCCNHICFAANSCLNLWLLLSATKSAISCDNSSSSACVTCAINKYFINKYFIGFCKYLTGFYKHFKNFFKPGYFLVLLRQLRISQLNLL